MSRAEILKAVMAMPIDEREQLVDELDELDELVHGGFATKEIEQAWGSEIERRIAEVDSGKVKTIPWSEVQAEVQEILGRVRDR